MVFKGNYFNIVSSISKGLFSNDEIYMECSPKEAVAQYARKNYPDYTVVVDKNNKGSIVVQGNRTSKVYKLIRKEDNYD